MTLKALLVSADMEVVDLNGFYRMVVILHHDPASSEVGFVVLSVHERRTWRQPSRWSGIDTGGSSSVSSGCSVTRGVRPLRGGLYGARRPRS